VGPGATAVTVRPAPVLPGPVGERRDTQTELTEAQREGLLVHAVMQWLAPPAPPRDEAGLAQLLGVDRATLAAPLARARRWLDQAHLAHLFDPARYEAAFNEFPLVDSAGAVRRIDRLVLTAGQAWVVDYKSGGLDGQAMDVYCRQLNDYRRAVAAIWPGREVKAGLVVGDGEWVPIGDNGA
jgi:ATP-dependent helicase/nuclease subunit A